MRFDLWPNIWTVLVNIPCAFQKNTYLEVSGSGGVCMSIRLLIMLFSYILTFLSACSVNVCERSVKIFYFSFSSCQLFFVYLEAILCGAYTFRIFYVFLLNWHFNHYGLTLFVSRNTSGLKMYLALCCYSHSSFLLVSISSFILSLPTFLYLSVILICKVYIW